MATNLDLDDDLIAKAVKIGKFKSKKEAVMTAITEYVDRHSQASILDFAGKVDYYPDYDYKKLRAETPMNILIDTSVWSLGLRRKRRDLNATELKVFFEWEQLLVKGYAAVIGVVRQEILSGIASRAVFESIRQRLAYTPDLPLSPDTYTLAAEFFNRCRAAGGAPGAIDMTICAAADIHDTPIFTTDPDFSRYARIIPVRLYHP